MEMLIGDCFCTLLLKNLKGSCAGALVAGF
jgi:hypothetical protein